MAVQAFENAEDLMNILRLDSDSVVSHREKPIRMKVFGCDLDPGRVLAAILDGVSHQILKQLHQPDLVRFNRRQPTPGNHCSGLLDGGLEVEDHGVQHKRAIDRRGRLPIRSAGLRVCQQICQ